MKNNQLIIILLALSLHVVIGATQGLSNTIYCMQQMDNMVIDCCRNIDLNGDGLDDLLLSCSGPNLQIYADLINQKEKGFCVRRHPTAPDNAINAVPSCSSSSV